jgi:hypothetical protein
MAQNPLNVSSTATIVYTFATGLTTTPNATLYIHTDVTSPIIYLGPNSSVTSSNGLPVGGGSDLYIRRSYGDTVYAICASGQAGTLKWSANTT